MNKISSVKEICEQIFSLEAEHGLLDFEVDGVKIWQYLRMPIYYHVAQACGVLEKPHPVPIGLSAWLRERFFSLKSSLLHNPFWRSQQVDVLVFDHQRSVSLDGMDVDIYTHFLLLELADRSERTLVVERPFCGTHLRTASKGRKHIDIVHLRHKFDLLIGRLVCSSDAQEKIGWLNTLLEDALGVELNLRPLLEDGVTRFISNRRTFRALLERLQPKRVYLVVAYSRLGSLIAAAKELGIEVVELQHGVFSRYHLGYSYPGRTAPLEYFPDKIETWGGGWSDLVEWPIPKSDVVASGFPYFHHRRAQCREVSRIPNRILVLSQGAIGKVLAARLSSCADELDAYEVVYKLHPSEYLCWREYPGLVELAQRSNVQVVDHNADLYRLFAEAKYQLGVFSTAVYEGIGMGCRTILFDLPGSEYMERLVDGGRAVVYKKGDRMADTLAMADDIDADSASRELFGDDKPRSTFEIN